MPQGPVLLVSHLHAVECAELAVVLTVGGVPVEPAPGLVEHGHRAAVPTPDGRHQGPNQCKAVIVQFSCYSVALSRKH